MIKKIKNIVSANFPTLTKDAPIKKEKQIIRIKGFLASSGMSQELFSQKMGLELGEFKKLLKGTLHINKVMLAKIDNIIG